ncbi:MAG TPA: ABC transporter permease [Candidatus Binataceae bacterium]|nr:ABC transporter permease [Candidatus Binataceae bacterium]
MKFLRLIFRNVVRNRRRTILTVLSIAVSMFIFAALFALPSFVDRVLASSASDPRLVCHGKAGLAYSLPESYARRIAAMPHVVGVDMWNWFGGIYHLPSDQFPNVAVDQSQIDTVWPDWRVSRESADAFQRERTAAIVGLATMQKFGFHLGQQITLRDSVYSRSLEFKIVGTLGKGTMPTMLIFRRDYLQEAIGRTGRADFIWIRADKLESMPDLIHAIDSEFANSSDPTLTESEKSFQAGFIESIRTIIRLAEGLSIIVLLTISLVAANTAAMSIRERRAELAVMRSIGFTSRQVVMLLIAEGALTGVIGGALGASTAWVVLRLLPLSGDLFGGLGAITMPASVPAGAISLSLLIGVLSGFAPATLAMRRSVVDELRAIV